MNPGATALMVMLFVGQFRCQGLREPDHAGLGGRVVGLAAVARDAGHRRQPDDSPALADGAVSDETLGKPLRSKQIDGDHRVPAGVVHVGQQLVAGDARVVDQDVGAAGIVLAQVLR